MLKNIATVLLTVSLGFSAPLSLAKSIKIATLSPEGSVWVKNLRSAAKEIKTATDNRVNIKVYPGGVMGNDKTVLRKMRIGQLHGALMPAGSLAKTFKDSQVYNLPMAFRDTGEVDYVRKSLDPVIVNGFNDNGMRVFGLAETGFAYMMSKNQIDTLSGIKSSKVWVPDEDKASLEIAKAFSVSPITLPISDVLTGLQTNLINTVGASPSGALALQWHTQLKYVVDVPVMYLFGVITIADKTFKRLSKADQEVVTRILTDATQKIDQLSRTDNEAAVSALKTQGLSFIPLASADQAQLSKNIEASWQSLVDSGEVSQGIVDQFKQLLNDYRKQ